MNGQPTEYIEQKRAEGQSLYGATTIGQMIEEVDRAASKRATYLEGLEDRSKVLGL